MATALATPAIAAAQLPPLDEYLVRVFDLDDGLPVSDVWDIERDSRGRLFVSTARGLLQYTGYAFRDVPLPTLEGEVLQDLRVDSRDRLWIVTRSGVVAVRDGASVRPVASVPIEPWRIDEAPDGRIWLSGTRGLAVLDSLQPGGFVVPEEVAGGRSAGLFTTAGQTVAVTSRGIFRVVDTPPPQARLLERVDTAIMPNSTVTVWADSSGIWIPRLDDLVRWRDGRVTTFGPGDEAFEGVRHGNSHVQRTRTSPAGARWRTFVDGSGAMSLVRDGVAGRTGIDLRRHLDFRAIGGVLPDGEGNVWVGTDKGLIQLAPRPAAVLGTEHGLADSFTVPVIQTADSSVWVGTWGGGLHRFAHGELADRLTTADGLQDDRVRALFEDADGTLWIGTVHGVTAYRDGRVVLSRRLPAWEVRTFARTPDGRFWSGTTRGLLTWENGEPVAFRDDLFASTTVWALHVDRSGDLWIGTEHGLFRLKGDSIDAFGTEDGLRSPWIDSIHEEADGTLWFGTYAHGIHRYRDDRFVPVTTAEGLHFDGVWRMLFDDAGGVWMSSDAGIFRVDRARLNRIADAIERGEQPTERLRPVVLTETEGLRSRESNRASPGGWRLLDGRLVFNNLDGLVVIDPERVLAATTPPDVEIHAVLVDGRSFDEAPLDSDVPPGTRYLAFEFGANAFVAPRQNRYRVRLDGYDDEWVTTGTRHRVEYTSLEPGRYTLRVQAATPSGPWGERGAEWTFRVLPEWWQTWWFRTAAATTLVALVVIAHRTRVRHVLNVERLRLRIASDLHDGVGSNLSSIALLSEMLRERTDLDGRERSQLDRIRNAASETIGSLRDIIWLVDPEHDNTADLVSRMRSAATDLLPTMDVEFEASGVEPRRLDALFVRQVFLLYREALHNVARHSGAARVGIEVGAVDGRFTLRIEDDGSGFVEAGSRRGLGLRSMRRRARETGGTLDIDSRPGGGTRITFSARMG